MHTHHDTIAFTAALTVALTMALATHADVPPPEVLPTTALLQPTGLPTPTPLFSNAASRDVVVLASRGDSATNSAGTSLPILLRWWERGAGGAWAWRGPLSIAGWPVAQGVPSTLTPLSMTDLDASGRVAIAVPITTTQIAVAGYDAGTWVSRGTIDAPLGEAIRSFTLVGDTIIAQSTQRLWAATRQSNGAWVIVDRSFADLGFEPNHVGSVRAVTSEDLLVTTTDPARSGTLGYTSYDWVKRSESGFMRGPTQPKIDINQFQIVSLAFKGISGAAIVQRADPATGSLSSDTVVFLSRAADGTLVPQQTETRLGANLSRAGTNALPEGRVIALGRSWSRGTDGHWIAGAYLPFTGRIEADANYVATSAGALWIVEGVFDCDGDGIDDAIAIASGMVSDCNANGHPDACDIAQGMVVDANHNGVPDLCEEDCDQNGISDIAQLRQGAPESCAHDGTLAACQILAGEADRDDNGIPDICDADRNGNGIPDVIEIAEGAAVDCDGDWRIDDAPAASMAMPIVNQAWGWFYPGSTCPGICVMTSLQAGEQLRSIDGFRFPVTVKSYYTCQIDGRALMAFVAIDPTNDGDPSDAQVIWWQSTLFAPDRAHPEELGVAQGVAYQRLWQYIATPHLEIDAPAVWIGFSYPPNTLAETACTLMNGNPPPSNLLGAPRHTRLSATNLEIPASPQEALSNPNQGSGGFNASVEVFSRHCGAPGDIDANGRVDGADLGRLLGDWGPAYGSPCDLNHDNSVDGADLAILIANFTLS